MLLSKAYGYGTTSWQNIINFFNLPSIYIIGKGQYFATSPIIDRMSEYAKDVFTIVDLKRPSNKYILNNSVTFIKSFMKMIPEFEENFKKYNPMTQNDSLFCPGLSVMFPATKIMHHHEHKEMMERIMNFTFLYSIGEEFFSDILPEI
ncbi:hypothetical protein HZS_2964 [Henneguya salminicola]|nr:hypothetical protein HZS_2964 [Henneguya salminicola]